MAEKSTRSRRPDKTALEQLAHLQDGYFTTRQASERGFSHQLLSHHAKTGWLVRVRRGLYRLATYPSAPHEDVRAAWLAVGPERAVVSHESALQVLGLSDLLPVAIHLTVARAGRGVRAPKGVVLHTTTRDVQDGIVRRNGLVVSAPDRAIAESAAWGTEPEEIQKAITEALVRGITTADRLRDAAQKQPPRVRELVAGAIKRPAPS